MHTDNHTSNQYRPDIDGLRAIAVLLVVGYHTFPNLFKGGFVGVDVFFVISGYLISRIIFNAMDVNQFSFIDFYCRRIKRIFPALIIVLLICLMIGWWTLLAGEYKQLGKHTAAGAAFVSNFVLWDESGYFDNDAITKPLLHLWSLGVEEQFYIVWPLFLWVAYKFRLQAVLVISCVALYSFTLNVSRTHIDIISAFYSPQSRFWELLFGSMLAWLSINKEEFFQQLNTFSKECLSLLGSILLLIGFVLMTDKSLFPGWWALLPVMGAVLVIAAGPLAWINRHILSSRVLVWFGLISFPLYLWHWPLLSFAYIFNNEIPERLIRLIIVAISILLSAITYYLIEKRIRHTKANNVVIVVLVGLMVMIGAMGMLVYKENGYTHRSIVTANLQPSHDITYRQNPTTRCIESDAYPLVNALCTKYVAQDSKKSIVLWGDSSTGAWLPVFLDVAAKNNYSLFHIMHLSCPPILDARKTRFNFEESRKYCSEGKTQREVLDWLKTVQPTEIVVMAAWNAYSGYSNREFITAESFGEANAQSTQRVIVEKLPATLVELSKISKTIIFTSWPMMSNSPNARKFTFFGKESTVVGIKREEFEKDVSSIHQVLNQVQRQLGDDRLVLFDPSKKICLQDQCLSVVNGVNYYLDKYHITPKGSLQFADQIERLLQ